MWRPTLLHHELTVSSLGIVCQSCTTPLPLYTNKLSQIVVEKSRLVSLGTGVDTHTHTSNLGFQLDSIATLGRMVRERQGEGVGTTVLFKHVSESAQKK